MEATMKKILLLTAALALFATSAFAVGADLTANACPGNAGASSSVPSLDCAGGAVLVLNVTFQPAEAISDLAAVDCIVDLTPTGGDPNTTANFWDFGVTNSAALGGGQARPSTGCTGYTNTFSPAGSGFAAAAATQYPSNYPPRTRISCLSYRPSNLSVAANAKLFGLQITVDASTSAEALGDPNGPAGCTLPVGIALEQAIPGSAAGNPTTTLIDGNTPGGNIVLVNGANAPTPTARHSWGQLKSLYR